MAKQMCELCQKNHENDMRFGVRLCEECIDGYTKAIGGDINMATIFSNADNFPYATEAAKKNIINVFAYRIKKMEAQEQSQEYSKQEKINEQEQKRESYEESSGFVYQTKNDNIEARIDSWYADIGKKIKGWARWIFIVEAIGAIISGLVVLFNNIDLCWLGLLIIVFGPIVAWVSSWILYAFGELVDKTTANEEHTKNILKLMLDNNAKDDIK